MIRCLFAGALLLLTGCGARHPQESLPGGWMHPEPPSRPESCTEMAVSDDLQARLDASPASEALCLTPGRHPGPLVVRHGVTLWGPREAVIASQGTGTTIRVEGDGARLLGFTVDGSGGRFDQVDAAVKVEADDVTVEGLHVTNSVFGILCERAMRATVRGNLVDGSGHGALGLRGDCIRLWETRESVVERNHVTGGRDIVVWYSPGNRVAHNLIERSRYGAHLMYSHGTVVEDNLFIGNVVGVFVMYSRNVTLTHNVMARSTGAAGMGLGIKESGNVTVLDNLIVRNTRGIYVDTSPMQVTDSNRFEDNQVRMCGTAVTFHSSARRNAFVRNSFRDNQSQVRVQGGGDALAVLWRENDFDTYQGYDMDGDGFGDVPYELSSLADALEDRHPELAFFHGAATLSLLDAASRAFPLLQPQKILVDPRPRFGAEEAPHAH